MRAIGVLFISDTNSSLDREIKNNDGNDYSHCGILCENKMVFQIDENGVSFKKVSDYENYKIYKLKNVVSFDYKKYMHLQYDYTYCDPTKSYCSKLVNDILNLIEEHYLVFDNIEFFTNYYAKFDMQIPTNVLGTNPNSISHSNKLTHK